MVAAGAETQQRGRSLPHNPAAEQAVLGAILLNPKVFHAAHSIIKTAEAFYTPEHQTVYQAIHRIVDSRGTVDVVLLLDHLGAHNQINDAGGYSAISELTSAVPTSANVEYYADIVHSCHVSRRLIKSLYMARKSAENGTSPKELIPGIIEALVGLEAGKQPVHGDDLYESYVRWYKEQTTRALRPGLRTGIYELDHAIPLGIQQDQLVVIGGRPSDGKTSLLLSICYNVIQQGKHVLVVSLETAGPRLMQRFHNLCLPTEHYMDLFSRQRYYDLKNLRDSYLPNLDELCRRLHILDGELYAEDIAYAVRALVYRRPEIALVGIDYLQMIDSRDRARSEYEQMNAVLRRITALRKDINRPVVLLSQLRRDDYKPNEGPTLAHLKGSGNIEQLADIAILLHNPNSQFEPDVKINAHIAKQRDGPKGKVELRFVKPQYLMLSPTIGRDDGPKQTEITNEPTQPEPAQAEDDDIPF